ncbi:MAG: endolytic transglycosylase MltG [Clostridiales bacterium]|nr:endolytic transglycosylase MltG [Clostridiales bacterium]
MSEPNRGERRRSSRAESAASSRKQMNNRIRNFNLDAVFSKMSRPTKVFIISFVIVLLLFVAVYKVVDIMLFSPVNPNSDEKIVVVVKTGSGPSTISNLLEENGIIRNATVYKLYLDINDKASKLKAGTYEFSPSMTMEEITEKLVVGGTGSQVVKLVLREGQTIEDLAQILMDMQVITNKENFLKELKSGEGYSDYSFIADASEVKDLKYTLEGYLFPDTYEIYVDSSANTIVTKLLNRFDQIYTDEYAERAEELGMTTHEVITLASVIEKEARTNDFKKVSAVFHNRLDQNMKLQSCVTVQYVLGIKKLNLSAEDTSVDSPYNTYKYAGLPQGPVCSPSKAAIEAALWPDETYVKQNYLYFCSKDPASGELAFARTLSEHNANTEKYRDAWREWDRQNGY